MNLFNNLMILIIASTSTVSAKAFEPNGKEETPKVLKFIQCQRIDSSSGYILKTYEVEVRTHQNHKHLRSGSIEIQSTFGAKTIKFVTNDQNQTATYEVLDARRNPTGNGSLPLNGKYQVIKKIEDGSYLTCRAIDSLALLKEMIANNPEIRGKLNILPFDPNRKSFIDPYSSGNNLNSREAPNPPKSKSELKLDTPSAR